MRHIVSSIEKEFRKYRKVAELAMSQLTDSELCTAPAPGANDIASIVRHLSGNLRSRFTDFLTTDGEKPWRNKNAEFAPRAVARPDLLADWDAAWSALFGALAPLDDAQLGAIITIRGEPHRVDEALHRALAHASYHVGQIVYQAKATRGVEWKDLNSMARR